MFRTQPITKLNDIMSSSKTVGKTVNNQLLILATLIFLCLSKVCAGLDLLPTPPSETSESFFKVCLLKPISLQSFGSWVDVFANKEDGHTDGLSDYLTLSSEVARHSCSLKFPSPLGYCRYWLLGIL